MPPFNVLKGYLYFIKDLYFDYVQDSNLSTNKKGTKRPAYYCFKDKQNSKILWFVPISSKYQKYKNIYNDKIQKQLIKNPNKKPSVDTLVFDKIANRDSVFLIQNMFPVLEKYIDNIYIKNNSFVNISVTAKNEIDFKSNKVLKLLDKGAKGLVFSDIKRLKNLMIKELDKETYLKEFFDNNNIEYFNDVKDIFNNSINEEDIKLYINCISNLQIKNDIDNIISNNSTIFDIKEEINKYINTFSLNIKQNININDENNKNEEEIKKQNEQLTPEQQEYKQMYENEKASNVHLLSENKNLKEELKIKDRIYIALTKGKVGLHALIDRIFHHNIPKKFQDEINKIEDDEYAIRDSDKVLDNEMQEIEDEQWQQLQQEQSQEDEEEGEGLE